MTAADCPAVLALWHATEHMGLGDSDRPEAIAAFLERNPGLSPVAESEDAIVGAMLCGHDGRRGSLYHLAVAPVHRRGGIGQQLVAWACDGLRAVGIAKATLFLLRDNHAGRSFWLSAGWAERDWGIMQREL